MPRKPINEQQPTECRQAIWEWIRANDYAPFSVDLLLHHVKLCPATVRDYLKGLTNAGYLSAEPGQKRFSAIIYTLVRDTGVDAPRVRKDGTPVTQGIGRQQMWNAIDTIKIFTAIDLAYNASTEDHRVAESEARTYCQMLTNAGYLTKKGDIYHLIPSMYTGPLPPQIQRTKQVYDPNLRRVIWSRIEGGAE